MLAESKLADHCPFGDSKALLDRLSNSLNGSEFVGKTRVKGGTDVYVGKKVGVDFRGGGGLAVQVEGKGKEEEAGVSVSIRSSETLNVRFAHADTSVSINNGMILAAVVIFPLHQIFSISVRLDNGGCAPEYSTSEKLAMFPFPCPFPTPVVNTDKF